MNEKKLFSLPSFTSPDTDVLQSFSGPDPRLKECQELSHPDYRATSDIDISSSDECLF